MARNLKFIPKLALFLSISAVVTVWADVKLRIFLQDGTLQAGNLVTETPETFVLLTKEGRAELKKEKIMFINGKTLKQWQERPDKLFQTEIIPSDIPNPSYVNDKAALPVVPAISNSKPVIQPVTKSVVISASVKPLPEKSSAPPPVQPIIPETKKVPVVAPVMEKPKPTPTPTPIPNAQGVSVQAESAPVVPVVPSLTEKPKVVRRRARKTVPAVAAVKQGPPDVSNDVDQPVKKNAPVSVSAVLDVPVPPRFIRKDFGDYHYQRAQAYLKTGTRGAAIQELHLATVLDRQNPESILLLGRLYMEEGEDIRAEKYFSHPLIRKREQVKKLVEEMAAASKKQEHGRWILYGGASFGLLAWVPFLLLWRKLRQPSVRVITAETAEEMVGTDPSVDSDVATLALIERPAPVEPAFVKILPVGPMASVKPLTDPPSLEKPQMESPLIKQPLVEKPLVGDPHFEKTTAEILKRMQETPVAPPPVVEQVPVPPLVEEPASSISAAQNLDTEAMLRVASMVERAIRQGNAYAVEEKFDLARREYRTAMALRPSCAEAHLGLGYLCFAQGQWELALEHYVKCMEIDSNSADAHYGIGRVLLETDRVNEAVPEFQKTLALDPTFVDARDTLTAIGAGA